MKVVVSGYVGKRITGIARNLVSILDNVSYENEYIVYTNYDMRGDLHFDNTRVEVKTYKISKDNSVGNLLWTTFVFPRVVKKERADKVIIPNFTLLLFKKTPTILILHDLIEFNVPNKFSKIKMLYRTRIANPISAKKADRIITVSNNSKKDIIRYLRVNPSKIQVIHNGVDRSIFYKMDWSMANSVIEKRGWPANFILYVGTIDHPGKNVIGIIKAFEMLKVTGKYNGNLILAGMPGHGYEIVRKYATYSRFNDQIFFVGYVNDSELVALYSNCDTFVFISLYEGFGIPPLEALSCGAKVVVSNTSSLPEVVGNIGKTVDPMDTSVVAQKISESLLLKCDNDYSNKVDEHLKRFEWNSIAKEFEERVILT